MNKDVIYIDVDDDVTSIIGKIKASEEKIVALVPPKRIGVLQSAVNLRLLDRMAKTAKKQLVIITNNQALISLTASATIPTARNLQSKPEIAEIPALVVDNDDDIIDGAELPVSDHMKSAGQKDEDTAPLIKKPSRDEAISTLSIDGEITETDESPDEEIKTKASKKVSKKDNVKIPNFNSFRKKLFLIIAAVLALTGLFIWMFIFAPEATVTITANTTPSPVSTTVKLAGSEATNYQEGKVKSFTEELKRDESIKFDATGTKEVGTEATGTVHFENCETDSTQTIPAGTIITTSDGLSYVVDEAATPTGATGFATCATPGTSAAVRVTATDVGADHNVVAGTEFAVEGHNDPSSTFYFKAVADSNFSGGDSKQVSIVSAADIERARGELIGRSTDDAKKALLSEFSEDAVTVDTSFTVSRGAETISPKEGEEVAEGKQATLTVGTTYTMFAVVKAELETYLKANLADRISGENTQRVYDSGVDSAQLGGFKRSGNDITATLTATGMIGPNVNEVDIKEEIKGKITGDVQSILEDIEGIQDVSVRYSYFWVRSVPNDISKIHLEFKLQENDK